MLYVFWGADGFSIRQELNKMKAALDPKMAGLNCVEAEASSTGAAELASLLQTMPFMGEKRLVVLRGLLAPFEPRQRPGSSASVQSGGEGNSPVPKKESVASPVLEILSNIPPTNDIVLVEDKLSQKNQLLGKLPKETAVREFPVPAGPELEAWIVQRVGLLGGSINSAASHVLAETVGPDLWCLDSEIRKLILYSEGKAVAEGDVRLLVSQVRESSVFALIDAIMAARSGTALGLTHQLIDGGTSPFNLLSLIARQVRLLLQAKELTMEGLSHQNMAGVLGFRSPWAAKKLAQQATGYTYQRLVAIYRRVADEDLALKTGKRTPELGLDLLVVELCSR